MFSSRGWEGGWEGEHTYCVLQEVLRNSVCEINNCGHIVLLTNYLLHPPIQLIGEIMAARFLTAYRAFCNFFSLLNVYLCYCFFMEETK